MVSAWKRNHEQLTSGKNAQTVGASQNLNTKKEFKMGSKEINRLNYNHSIPQNTKSSDKSQRKGVNTTEVIDNGNLSSSTNSSFSSIASIRKKPNISKSENNRKQETPSPQIPPRAPVLETLKRTKRELVSKQSIKRNENPQSQVVD